MPDDMKERIISECEIFAEKKNNINTEYEEHHVFKAERVSPHPIRSAVSVAAAVMLFLGGIGGGMYIISRGGIHQPGYTDYRISPFGDFREMKISVNEFDLSDVQNSELADFLNNYEWQEVNRLYSSDNEHYINAESENSELYYSIWADTYMGTLVISVYSDGTAWVNYVGMNHVDFYNVDIAEFSNGINNILSENEITVESAVFSNNPYILTNYRNTGNEECISEKKEITKEQKEFIKKLWNENVSEAVTDDFSVSGKQCVLSIVNDVSENITYAVSIYENNIAEFIRIENDKPEVISYYNIGTSEFEVNIFPMFNIPPFGDIRYMPVSKYVKGEALTTDTGINEAEMSDEKKEKLAELFDSVEWKLSSEQLTSFDSEYTWTIEFGSYADGGFNNYMVVSEENGGFIQILLSGKVYTYDIDFEYVDTKLTEIFGDGKLYSELELFSGLHTIEGEELFKSEEFMITDNLYDRIGINRQPYIQKLLSADSDSISDIETKSYIYHMMLNSVDYFDSAEGECSHGDYKYVFRTDIPAQSAHETVYYGNELTDEHDYYINKPPVVEELENGRQHIYKFDTQTTVIFPKDSYRRFMESDGRTSASLRTDWTNLQCSQEFLLPQNIALTCLSDFDTWDITGIEEKSGRKCAVLEGTCSRGDFKLSVDTETGIMLFCHVNGYDPIDYEITSLKLTVRDF